MDRHVEVIHHIHPADWLNLIEIFGTYDDYPEWLDLLAPEDDDI